MGSASKRRIEPATLAESSAGFCLTPQVRARVASALLASVLGSGCSSNHHVSPWGNLNGPPLGAFVEAPDLEARLADVDREAQSLGLELDRQIEADVKGARFVARSYVGVDAIGKATHACRIATPFGVVLAAGPANDPLRRAANELVPALGPEGAFRSLTDLAGSGALAIVLRAEDGRLEMWRVESRGSTEMEIDMEVVATQASDVDDDGRLDFGGTVLVRDGEALRPSLTDVAMFDGTRYTDRAPAARAWHAKERDAHKAKDGAKPDEKLRATLETAWHAILAGDDRKHVLAELAKTKPPAELRGAFAAYALRIEHIDAER